MIREAKRLSKEPGPVHGDRRCEILDARHSGFDWGRGVEAGSAYGRVGVQRRVSASLSAK